MRSLKLIIVFFLVYIGFYFLLSLLGLIWVSYIEALRNEGWLTFYIVVGWIPAAIVVVDMSEEGS